MVVTYLEKIKDRYVEDKVDLNAKITQLSTTYKENIEIIKLLEQNNDSNFEAFTPRTVNSFNKMKIEELKDEQKDIEIHLEELNRCLYNIEKDIEEVNNVIRVAKEKMM